LGRGTGKEKKEKERGRFEVTVPRAQRTNEAWEEKGRKKRNAAMHLFEAHRLSKRESETCHWLDLGICSEEC